MRCISGLVRFVVEGDNFFVSHYETPFPGYSCITPLLFVRHWLHRFGLLGVALLQPRSRICNVPHESAQNAPSYCRFVCAATLPHTRRARCSLGLPTGPFGRASAWSTPGVCLAEDVDQVLSVLSKQFRGAPFVLMHGFPFRLPRPRQATRAVGSPSLP